MTGGILVLRALGLGDLLTAVPALRALRRAFDGERLVLAAPENLRDLVELIDAVDELLPTAGLGELSWPGEPPRLAVNLHGRGPESIHDLLAQDPLELITHRHPDFPGVDGPDWPAEAHEVDRWCRLLEAARIPADRDDLALPPPPGPSPASDAVVIHPGAAFAARRWPPDRYARVARELSARHRVVVTGNTPEAPLVRAVVEEAGLPGEAALVGGGLAELAATVAEARLVICGDTGVGHLATAYGTPSVLLFGPTPPRLWGPPAGDRRHTVLWVGDVGDPHGGAPDPGLLLLREERVLAAAEDLLQAGATRG